MKTHQAPIPKINFLVKSNNEAKNISKTLKFYFTAALIVFALNFGLYKSSKLKVLIPFINLFQALCVSAVIYVLHISNLTDTVFKIWYGIYILEYFILLIVLNLTKNNSFFDLYYESLEIDRKLGNRKDKTTSFVPILTGVTFIYRFSLSFIFCVLYEDYCMNSKTALVIFMIPLLSIDMFLIVYFMIFYTAQDRVAALISIVKNKKADVIWCHDMYKSIVNNTEIVKKMFNTMYLVPLVFHTLDVMMTLFYPLISVDFDRKNASGPLTVANLSVIQVCLILFAPTYSAGLLSGKVQELKLVLHDILLKEKEENQQRDIRRFIGYVEARPLKFRICRIVPLDWSLPVSVLNICLTYLIVMLQFSQKY